MKLCKSITNKLVPVPASIRHSILQSEKTEAVHRHYMALDCFQQIEFSGKGREDFLPVEFRVVAWNLERCLDINGSATLLSQYNPDIVLLSEMDNGMSRTGQQHTTQALAKLLGMYYLYGVEFLELSLGGNTELKFAKDSFNTLGWHGNALLSKYPIMDIALLRYDEHGHWFKGNEVRGSDIEQPRVGGRMALLAKLSNTIGKEVVFVSTHLESNEDVHYRDAQMKKLLEACNHFAGKQTSIIIGGDLNTGNNLGEGKDFNDEYLFLTAEQQGFHWQANPAGATTHSSLITPQNRAQKLDWFCVKNATVKYAEIIPAYTSTNKPLSDHDIILADFNISE